jgi:glycosyltransferase involved in cell wall biosynthesis
MNNYNLNNSYSKFDLEYKHMKIILFANSDWFLYNYNLSLAKFLRGMGHEVVLLSPSGSYIKFLEQEEFQWHEFNLSRKGMNPFSEIKTIRRLQTIIQDIHPDIVHNFTLKSVLYGSLAVKKKKQIKTINTITGLGYLFINHGIVAKVVRSFLIPVLRYALQDTTVIFLNETDRSYYLQHHIVQPEHAFIINGAGVDIEKFQPVRAEDRKEKTRNVIFPARLLKDKGIYEFVEAARITKQQHPEVVFVLVGSIDEGNPSSVTSEEIKAWQKEGIIEWWGWQKDMVKIYHRAFLVCLPSYREGLATSLLEAAACGVPIIATDVPGCREVVRHNETGFLVPARDAKALAGSIIYLLDHQDLLVGMGLKGRELIINKYPQERINAETYKLYFLK